MSNIKTSHNYIIEKIREMTPSMRFDGIEDYAIWKMRARNKLYELLGLPLDVCDDLFEITEEEDCGDTRRIHFTFQSEEGYFVPGTFLLPKQADFPLPLTVCAMGHYTGMHISYGVAKYPEDVQHISNGGDFLIRAVKEGCCAVVIESRYMGVCGQTETGSPSCCSKNAALPSLLLGRTAIGERVWDVQRLLDVMEKYFSQYIDKEKIICMGNSGGGVITYYASCVDDRIKLSMPSCSVCEFEESIVPLHHCCCNYIPGIRKYFEMGDMGGLIADRKLVIVCGVQDPEFPIWGVEKSYERAREVFVHLGKERDCCLVKGEAGHQFYPDLAWPVVKKMLGF